MVNILELIKFFVIIVIKDSEIELLLFEEEVVKGLVIEEKIVDDFRFRYIVFICDKN